MNNDEWLHPYIRKTEKRQINAKSFEYCQAFDLINDPELMKAGVEVCAVLTVDKERLQGRIRFIRGDKSAEVTCINVVVDKIVFDGEEEVGFRSVSSEGRGEIRHQIPPEEHYIALKSFVGYLVEEGILRLLLASFEAEQKYGKQEFDINHLMRQQIVKVLFQLAPEATGSILEIVLVNGCTGDSERDKIFIRMFVSMFNNRYALRLFLESLKKMKLTESLLRGLVGDENGYVRAAIASRDPTRMFPFLISVILQWSLIRPRRLANS